MNADLILHKMISCINDRGLETAVALDGAGIAFVGGEIVSDDSEGSDLHVAALEAETGQV